MNDTAAKLGVSPEDWEIAYDWVGMLRDEFRDATELALHAAINAVSAKVNAVYPALEAGDVVSFSLDDLGGTLMSFSQDSRREFLNQTAMLFNAAVDGPSAVAQHMRIAATQSREGL